MAFFGVLAALGIMGLLFLFFHAIGVQKALTETKQRLAETERRLADVKVSLAESDQRLVSAYAKAREQASDMKRQLDAANLKNSNSLMSSSCGGSSDSLNYKDADVVDDFLIPCQPGAVSMKVMSEDESAQRDSHDSVEVKDGEPMLVNSLVINVPQLGLLIHPDSTLPYKLEFDVNVDDNLAIPNALSVHLKSLIFNRPDIRQWVLVNQFSEKLSFDLRKLYRDKFGVYPHADDGGCAWFHLLMIEMIELGWVFFSRGEIMARNDERIAEVMSKHGYMISRRLDGWLSDTPVSICHGLMERDIVRKISFGEFLNEHGQSSRAAACGQKTGDLASMEDDDGKSTEGIGDLPDDPMIAKSWDVIRSTKRATTSMLQRRLSIGYNRAARIMDILHKRGYIGPENGSSPREILREV
jgi:hypothetical protein